MPVKYYTEDEYEDMRERAVAAKSILDAMRDDLVRELKLASKWRECGLDAQLAVSALSSLHTALGVDNQTQAIQKIKEVIDS